MDIMNDKTETTLGDSLSSAQCLWTGNKVRNMKMIEEAVIAVSRNQHAIIQDCDFYDDFVKKLSIYLVSNAVRETLGDKPTLKFINKPGNPIYDIAMKYTVMLLKRNETFEQHMGYGYRYSLNVRYCNSINSEPIATIRKFIQEFNGCYIFELYTIASRHWVYESDVIIDLISFRKENKICYDIITPYTGKFYMYNRDCDIGAAIYYLDLHPDSEFELNRTKECLIFLNEFINRESHLYPNQTDIFSAAVNRYSNKYKNIKPIILRMLREIYNDKPEEEISL